MSTTLAAVEYKDLNAVQKSVADAVASGENILVTGPAGTGKSTLLAYLGRTHKDIVRCATTGVAALNVGGSTINSWARLGLCKDSAKDIAAIINERDDALDRIKRCTRLAIDEISMMSANTVTLLDAVLKIVRKNQMPFGGIQMIFFGDFLQLPPIGDNGGEAAFAFESDAWKQAGVKVHQLTTIIRQADVEFGIMLRRIRVGQNNERIRAFIASRTNAMDLDPENPPIDITTHNEIADGININAVAAINAPSELFVASEYGSPAVLRRLDKDCLAPKELRLKVGARVMLLRNVDVEGGLANGSIGTIVGFEKTDKLPIVCFANGSVRSVEEHTWEVLDGDEKIGERKQIPLRIAYAISVHKSQGLSFDKIRVHLSRGFATGQAYVALSRVRTIEGLFVASFSNTSIKANRKAVEFYFGPAESWPKRSG